MSLKALFAVAPLLVLGLACDPSHGVDFVNRTSSEIRIYEIFGGEAELVTSLAPGETKSIGFGRDFWPDAIVARDEFGVVVEWWMTWSEFKELDRLVIE